MLHLDYESNLDRPGKGVFSTVRRDFTRPATIVLVAGVVVGMAMLSDPRGLRSAWLMLLWLCGGWYVLARIVRSDADPVFKVIKSMVGVPAALLGAIAAAMAWPRLAEVRAYGWTHLSPGQSGPLKVLGLCIAVYGIIRLAERICDAADRRAVRDGKVSEGQPGRGNTE